MGRIHVSFGAQRGVSLKLTSNFEGRLVAKALLSPVDLVLENSSGKAVKVHVSVLKRMNPGRRVPSWSGGEDGDGRATAGTSRATCLHLLGTLHLWPVRYRRDVRGGGEAIAAEGSIDLRALGPGILVQAPASSHGTESSTEEGEPVRPESRRLPFEK